MWHRRPCPYFEVYFALLGGVPKQFNKTEGLVVGSGSNTLGGKTFTETKALSVLPISFLTFNSI